MKLSFLTFLSLWIVAASVARSETHSSSAEQRPFHPAVTAFFESEDPFVSMHAHNPRKLWASPEEMYRTYHPYLNSGVMIHLPEFGIILGEITGDYRTGQWDEDKLAESPSPPSLDSLDGG